MDIVIIGAGNVATHLAIAMKKAGHAVIQVYSRTEVSAKKLASELQCGSTSDFADVDKCADVYVVSVVDSALTDVAKNINSINPGALWVHTSGSMPLDTLKCRRRGVLYPLQTFSIKHSLDTTQIPFFIESNSNKDLEQLSSLAHSISENVSILDSEKRRQIHLAAVFCCNFVNHCCSLADNILKSADQSFSVMLPLLEETISKLHELTPLNAQTGPAVRYDKNVIEKHLSMLNGNKSMQNIYSVMSDSIHELHNNSKENQQ